MKILKGLLRIKNFNQFKDSMIIYLNGNYIKSIDLDKLKLNLV